MRRTGDAVPTNPTGRVESIEEIAKNSIVSAARFSTSGYAIESPAAVRALASPVRQEIVDAVTAAGPCTIAQLGKHLGRAPDSLYFHVRRLVAVGLLVERDAQRRGRHVAAVYDVPGRPMRVAYASRVPARSIQSVVKGALRLGMRDFERAFSLSNAAVEGPGRNLWGGRAKGWVSEAEAREINAHIDRIMDIIHAGRPGKGRRQQSFSFVLAPVQPSRRSSRPSSSPGVSP